MCYWVCEHQASEGHDQAEPECTLPEHYVDASFFRLHDNFAISIPLAVERIKIVNAGLRVLHGDKRAPELDISPTLICFNKRFFVGPFFNLFKFTPGFFKQAFKAGLFVIHSGAGLAD